MSSKRISGMSAEKYLSLYIPHVVATDRVMVLFFGLKSDDSDLYGFLQEGEVLTRVL